MVFDEYENIFLLKPDHILLALLADPRTRYADAWQHPGTRRLVNPREAAFEHLLYFCRG
jgi:hypothetical protein